MNKVSKNFVWESEVRDYELDSQGVVNNAIYFHYFEHARHHYLNALGVNFIAWQKQGFDFVLVHADITYKAPLYSGDQFFITTRLDYPGRLKLHFIQELYKKPENILVSKFTGTSTCINSERKPEFPNELIENLKMIMESQK
jgi:acyl-CoA thioester hydrolase